MISLVLAATIYAAVPPDLDQFEKVLLPVVIQPMFPAPTGVNGSQYSSAAYGVAATPTRIWSGGEVETRTGYIGFDFTGNSHNARILYVERAHAAEMSLNAILASAPANGRWYRATLPVVRESDLFTSTAHILGIDSSYLYETGPDGVSRSAIEEERHHLRVYDVDARGNAQVRVTRYDQNLGAYEIESFVLTLDRREGTDPTYPTYAEILIPELCHPFSRHTPCMGGTQWLAIEPLTPGLRFFPIASATDNTSQQVTVIWPQ